MQKGDGWAVDGWVAGRFPHGGVIHRYGYCFNNEARAKAVHHYFGLYGQTGGEPPDTKLAEVQACRLESNFLGQHPGCVEHFLNWIDYDIEKGLKATKVWLENQV